MGEALTLLDVVRLHLHVAHELRGLIVRGVQVLVSPNVASRRDGRNSILGKGVVGQESHGLHTVSCYTYIYLSQHTVSG
jgi:hypothetical protein